MVLQLSEAQGSINSYKCYIYNIINVRSQGPTLRDRDSGDLSGVQESGLPNVSVGKQSMGHTWRNTSLEART